MSTRNALRHNTAPQDTDTAETLTASLAEARHLVVGLHKDPEFMRLINEESTRLALRGVHMEQSRFFRHAADWAARSRVPTWQRTGEYTREHLLATLLFSTADAVITTRQLPTLEGRQHSSRQDALVLGYAQERLARFGDLLHETATAYPEMKPSKLHDELERAYTITGSAKPGDLRSASTILDNMVQHTQAEFGLADLLSRDPNTYLEWGTPEQRKAGAPLVAHIAIVRQRQDGTPRTLTIGIQPQPSMEAIEAVRTRAGQDHDPTKPCSMSVGEWMEDGRMQPFVHAEMFSMLTPDSFADAWHPTSKAVEDRWEGTSIALMRATVAARLDHYAE